MRKVSAAEIVALVTVPLRKGVTVDLADIEVDEPLDLSGRVIANVDFSRAHFAKSFAARGATFAGLAWFREARFSSSVDFSRAVLGNDLRMKGARFRGAATFTGAELSGVFDLDGARFEDRADLDRLVVMGNVSMAGTRFDAPTTLQDSDFMGGLWLEGAAFASRADFCGVEVHGRTWLKRATVSGMDGPGQRDPLREIQSFGYRWT